MGVSKDELVTGMADAEFMQAIKAKPMVPMRRIFFHFFLIPRFSWQKKNLEVTSGCALNSPMFFRTMSTGEIRSKII